MGQYYTIANVDKKEYIYPHAYGCGAKLMEFSWIGNDLLTNDFMSAFVYLLMNDWKGDKVYVIGDYANCNEECEADKNWLNTYSFLCSMFGLGDESLYNHVNENFKERKLEPLFDKTKIPRYLCNLGYYIDLLSLPVEWVRDKVNMSIFPLPLLLAMGNNRGSGDYHPKSEYVGKWVDTSDSIFFSDTIPEGFRKINPNFTEK